MTDKELLEQVKMSKLWIEPEYMAESVYPWHWRRWRAYRVIDAIPVNREYLNMLLNRLEDLLDEKIQNTDR